MKYYVSKRVGLIIAEDEAEEEIEVPEWGEKVTVKSLESRWYLYCLKFERIRDTENYKPGFMLLNFKPNMNVYEYVGDEIKDLKKHIKKLIKDQKEKAHF